MSNPNEMINNFLAGNSSDGDQHDNNNNSNNNDSNSRNATRSASPKMKNKNANNNNSNDNNDNNSNNNSNNNNNNNNNNSNNHTHNINETHGKREDNFDYERQGPPHRQQSPIQATSSLPSASYIPQYTVVDSGMPFPIQEVIPNTYVTMSTGMDSSNNHNSNTSGLRTRAPTVTANVLNVGDFYYDDIHHDLRSNYTKKSTHHDSHTNHTSQHNNATNNHYNDNNGENNNGMDNNDDNDEPMNVPLMVKPRTLYQNPQTPTVLPSTYHPINKWSSIKQSYIKEFLAEFLGTLVMILLGTAVCCQVNLAGVMQQANFNNALNSLNGTVNDETIEVVKTMQDIVSSVSGGTFDDIPLGWAAAVVMGYFCSGGSAISGAHLNPSITISNWVFRGFPTKKVPLYLAGQVLGGFSGALITFIFYRKVLFEAYGDQWRITEAAAGNFVTFPKSYLSSSGQFVSEYIATAVLQACIFAMTDPYTCLSTDVFPLMLFILIFSLNASVGYTTGCAINLARDLGPRLALYAVGFDRKLLWIHHKHYFWVPITAPIIGALTGSLIYDICIYQGHESPVNWPYSVYKEKLQRLWVRRPGWYRRTRERATSDLSEFSYHDDDDEGSISGIDNSKSDIDSKNGNFNKGHGTSVLKKTKTRTKSEGALDEDYVEKNVTFKSVQRNKRNYGGIPTILEEDSTSSFIEDSESMMLSSVSSSLPNFVPREYTGISDDEGKD